MTKKIDRVLYQVKGLFPKTMSSTEKSMFESLLESLREFNKLNVDAQIEVGRVSEDTVDIDDMQYSEDYEVVTSNGYRDEDGNEFSSEDEARDYKTKQLEDEVEVDKDFVIYDIDGYSVWDTVESFREAVDYVDRNDYRFEDEGVIIKPWYFVKDDRDIVMADEGYEYESDADEALEEYISEKVDNYIDNLEQGEPDEVMWNTVYTYNGMTSQNHELAKQCGLAVVRMSRSGHEYLALTGCGMDFSPQLIAYYVLEFGYADENDTHHFTSKSKREYFKYVVGTETYERVLAVLGIAEAVAHEEKEEA